MIGHLRHAGPASRLGATLVLALPGIAAAAPGTTPDYALIALPRAADPGPPQTHRYRLSAANAINDRGEVVGHVADDLANTSASIWLPSPRLGLPKGLNLLPSLATVDGLTVLGSLATDLTGESDETLVVTGYFVVDDPNTPGKFPRAAVWRRRQVGEDWVWSTLVLKPPMFSGGSTLSPASVAFAASEIGGPGGSVMVVGTTTQGACQLSAQREVPFRTIVGMATGAVFIADEDLLPVPVDGPAQVGLCYDVRSDGTAVGLHRNCGLGTLSQDPAMPPEEIECTAPQATDAGLVWTPYDARIGGAALARVPDSSSIAAVFGILDDRASQATVVGYQTTDGTACRPVGRVWGLTPTPCPAPPCDPQTDPPYAVEELVDLGGALPEDHASIGVRIRSLDGGSAMAVAGSAWTTPQNGLNYQVYVTPSNLSTAGRSVLWTIDDRQVVRTRFYPDPCDDLFTLRSLNDCPSTPSEQSPMLGALLDVNASGFAVGHAVAFGLTANGCEVVSPRAFLLVPAGVLCSGDLNLDGQVDGADLGTLLGSWGDAVECRYDFDGNGTIDGGDLGVLLGGWGPCAKPMPDDVVVGP